ncbi:MAG: hypothetical protein AB7O26_20675, partial [Planctomycetaceae bacterium]
MPGRSTQLQSFLIPAIIAVIASMMTAVLLRAEGEAPRTERPPVVISADFAHTWRDGNDEVLLLRGRCQVTQGNASYSAQKMVIWRTTEQLALGRRDRLAIYLEDDARAEKPGETLSEPTLYVTLATRDGVVNDARKIHDGNPAVGDTLFQRALARHSAGRRTSRIRDRNLTPTQLEVSDDESLEGPELRSVQVQPPPGALRRVRI